MQFRTGHIRDEDELPKYKPGSLLVNQNTGHLWFVDQVRKMDSSWRVFMYKIESGKEVHYSNFALRFVLGNFDPHDPEEAFGLKKGQSQ